MDDLLSIVVPIYNVSSYLQRCIKSILAQTYRNLEVIVIDDGSTDDSLVTVCKFAQSDKRIRVFHQANHGVTSARLAGVSKATGDWIGFVDGDDTIEPYMYERLLANAYKYQADIAHCGYQMVFPSRIDYYYNTGTLVEQTSREAVRDLLSGAFEPGLCNKLFRKSLFLPLTYGKGINRRIRINEDLLMNYYLFREAKKTIFEDVCPYHYIVRKGSAATSEIKPYKLRDPARVRMILMEETQEDQELFALCFSSYIAHLTRVSTMKCKGSNIEIKKCIFEARNKLRSYLPAIICNNRVKRKNKILAFWAIVWPESYHFVHFIYGELSGAAHKYDIK